jgi:PAS domain S-box-containing protein
LILSQFSSDLKDHVNTVIASIEALSPNTLVLLTLYEDGEHIICGAVASVDNASCCKGVFDKALKSKKPISLQRVDCSVKLDGELANYYLGFSLRSPDGIPLGVLSLYSVKPFQFEQSTKQLLTALAQCIADKLTLYKKEIELKEIEEFSSLITDTNQDYIFVKDTKFQLVRANPSFIALHPESIRKYLFSSDWTRAYKKEEAERFLVSDALAFKEGRAEVKEKITLPNGEVLLLETTKTRFEDSKGHQYILGVSRDISEREKLLLDLQKSNQDLDEFAYIASHDLKAPLNAIERLVSWIEEDSAEQLDEESKKHFGMIKGRVNRMSNLLSDLLSYSRIGREEHEPVCLNLKQSVLNCFELLDIPAGFNVEIDEVDIVLPRVPLELILTNLVSNAIKHHDRESGVITVSYAENDHHHEIVVADDGPGISPTMYEKVFERFQTLKPRDQVEGSGMGLAMVRKTARYLGGDIRLKSDIGKGSTFTFYWPISFS